MAHEIESMMFQGETPWHGLGTATTGKLTADEAMRAAGLDWRVSLTALVLADGRPAMPDPVDADDDRERSPHNAVVRDSDGKILGIVGPDFVPLQNREAFGWFDPFVASGEATYHTAGSLRGGQRSWVLAQLAADPIDVLAGDAVRPFVLLSNAHDGSMSVRCGFTPIRVVCANTLSLAHGAQGSQLIRVKHTANLADNLDAVRATMDLAQHEFRATAEVWHDLARRDINTDDLTRYIKTVFHRSEGSTGTGIVLASSVEPSTEGARIVPKIEGIFNNLRGDSQLSLEARKPSFWRAFNAVTEYIDHARGSDADSRLNSAWFGDGATIKRRAMEVATRMARAA